MGRIAALALIVLCVGGARAEESGDLQTARRHFDLGAQFYDAGDWPHALDEFLTAQRLHPVPAFDFNIARCYDRLGDREHAIEHYKSYVATHPADTAMVQQRIDELERAVAASRPAPPPPPSHKRRTLAIVLGTVGGALVAGTVVALGVTLGRPAPDYSPSTLGSMKVTP